MKAAILGATGLTGSILLDYLLDDPDYDSVTVFSRRKLSFEHPKLTVHIIDLMDHKSIENLLKGDVVFVNIGTTLKKTPDKELYFSIDHGIPVNVSRIAKTNGFNRILVVSSMGADANSTVFYNRTKGQMEKDVIENGPAEAYIFRPSLIDGPRPERRIAERTGIMIFRILNLFLWGPLRKYRMIKAEKISKAMQLVGKNGYGQSIIESDLIADIAVRS